MIVYGLLVSDGTVVSSQESASRDSAVIFGTIKKPASSTRTGRRFNHRDLHSDLWRVPDPHCGVNVVTDTRRSVSFTRGTAHAYALSQDRKTLYLLAIDGRQSGYSDGALDWETAAWLIKMGAYDGVNMDGAVRPRWLWPTPKAILPS